MGEINMRQVAGAFGLLSASLLTTAVGCHKKVDCNKFCDREKECVRAISVQLGAATEEQMGGFSEAEVKPLGEKQRDRCMKSCNDESKPKLIDDKWRGCLEKTDCKAFAACVYDTK